MYGSANATQLAATIQWNDIYTMTKSRSKYVEFQQGLQADAAPARGQAGLPALSTTGKMQLGFYPYTGRQTPAGSGAERAEQRPLHRCDRVVPASRPHQDPDRADRECTAPAGLAIAHRLAAMKKRGCNIRLVYAMFGRQALQVMRNDAGPGGVPMTHLAYDADCNGIYDKYVHMKSMTVSGVYGKKHPCPHHVERLRQLDCRSRWRATRSSAAGSEASGHGGRRRTGSTSCSRTCPASWKPRPLRHGQGSGHRARGSGPPRGPLRTDPPGPLR